MREKFKKYFKGDLGIWMLIFILAIVSMLTVYSATGSLAYKRMDGNTTYFLFRHLTFLAVGIGIIYIVHNISYKIFFSLSIILLYLSVILLTLTLAIGVNLNEASRWLTLPGTGLTFQTSDLAKIALITYIARILSMSQDNISDFKKVLKPILIWTVIICGLILPANFSTAAMLFLISLGLMFIGRIPVKQLMLVIGTAVVGGALFLMVIWNFPQIGRFKTWKTRIETFVDKDSNTDNNYQANQAKIAIVNGGLFGKGPGNSVQRNYIPHPYSDFIYAIIIEEYGLIGGFMALLMYLFLLYRVGIIVKKSKRTFQAFLATGLALSLVIQALINMAVAVNIFPVTGQTLPFVSMGGTSIIFTSGAFGIILNISRQVYFDQQQDDINTENIIENNENSSDFDIINNI
jgi:cell division protein FtsW